MLKEIKMENNKKEKEAEKTGIIPNEQIKGSDADKAYDEDGNFKQPELTKHKAAKTEDHSTNGAED